MKKDYIFEFERYQDKTCTFFEDKNIFKLVIINLKILESFDNSIWTNKDVWKKIKLSLIIFNNKLY